MADDGKKERRLAAEKVYSTMANALKAADWTFDEHADDLVITSGYQGDDIPLRFMVAIDAEREAIRFYCPINVTFSDDQTVDAAVATCVANFGMVNGNFDFNLKSGEISFRLTTSYCDCAVGEGFFMDMLSTALQTCDRYNDQFLMLSKGNITLQQFIEKENA